MQWPIVSASHTDSWPTITADGTDDLQLISNILFQLHVEIVEVFRPIPSEALRVDETVGVVEITSLKAWPQPITAPRQDMSQSQQTWPYISDIFIYVEGKS
jgi:hypothetical protein